MKRDLLKALCAAALVIALAGAAATRNATWHSLLAMWEDCARKSPNKSRTHNNLGNCHVLLERYFPAIAEYQKAIALEWGNLEAHYNLATALDTVGLYSQAMRSYEVFCRMAPPALAEHKQRACTRLQELLDEARRPRGAGGRP